MSMPSLAKAREVCGDVLLYGTMRAFLYPETTFLNSETGVLHQLLMEVQFVYCGCGAEFKVRYPVTLKGGCIGHKLDPFRDVTPLVARLLYLSIYN